MLTLQIRNIIANFEKTPGFQPEDESNFDVSSSLRRETANEQFAEDAIANFEKTPGFQPEDESNFECVRKNESSFASMSFSFTTKTYSLAVKEKPPA